MIDYREALSPQEIQNYQAQGYSTQDLQNAVDTQLQQNQVDTQLMHSFNNIQQQTLMDPRNNASNTMVSSALMNNLVQWQLEVDSIIERIEHMLRGDKPVFRNGNLIWMPPENKMNQILNDEGVAEIIRLLSVYINRNTLLSNYREEVIDLKIYYLGRELSDLIYCKYEMIGMDTLEKRKYYPMIVREVVDQVHSAYLRALHGMERESLRKMVNVTQTDAMNNGMMNQGMVPMAPARERGMLNPMRLLFGKYK